LCIENATHRGLELHQWTRAVTCCALAAYHLVCVQAATLLIGTYSTFSGSTIQAVVPSFTNLFGFIYFESIFFALGTSVFILALVKERNEATGMAKPRGIDVFRRAETMAASRRRENGGATT
jgi:hypothetical protein